MTAGSARLRKRAFGESLRPQTKIETMPWKILIASFALAGSLLAQPAPSPAAGAKRPFTFADMMKLKRVGGAVPSPDGKWVVFDAVDVDLEANTRVSHLWIVPAAGGKRAA